MSKVSKKVEVLTGRHLRVIASSDHDTPSLKLFLIVEAIEWLMCIALLFVLYVSIRAIVETFYRHLLSLYEYVASLLEMLLPFL